MDRRHPDGMLVVNCKNYREMSAPGLRTLAAASAVGDTQVAIAPPHHLLGVLADSPIMVLAQHVDVQGPGSTTGYVIPELLCDAGVSGSILNHSEHRLEPDVLQATTERLRELGMVSVLCTRDITETRRYVSLQPDYIAIEPPELIGTGRSISTEKPDIIREAAHIMRDTGVTLLCGAGITSGDDVSHAVRLGAEGILVASGVVKAPDPAKVLLELAAALPKR